MRGWRLRPSGYAFIVTGILVQLAAWNTGTNLYYVMAGTVFSFVVVAFVFTRLVHRRLRVVQEAPASVHRGAPFGITIHLTNEKRVLPSVSVHIEREAQQEGTEQESAGAYIAKLEPGEHFAVRMQHVLHRRGVYQLPPLTLRSAFPFGLFERWIRILGSEEVVVYPRVRAVRTGVMEQLEGSGETSRNVQGEGDEFFSLRDYVRGDDLRKIAWRVSARVGHLVVRELEPSTSRNVYIVLDTARAPHADDFDERFEEAVELAASLAVSFVNSHYNVAVITPEASCPLGEGNAHGRRILDMLARVTPTGAHAPADWHTPHEDIHGAGFIFVTPDPAKWRVPAGFRGARYLDPREVVRA